MRRAAPASRIKPRASRRQWRARADVEPGVGVGRGSVMKALWWNVALKAVFLAFTGRKHTDAMIIIAARGIGQGEAGGLGCLTGGRGRASIMRDWRSRLVRLEVAQADRHGIANERDLQR